MAMNDAEYCVVFVCNVAVVWDVLNVDVDALVHQVHPRKKEV